ncbi:WSC domain-containing protein, partial [Mycena amicta]
RTLTGYSFTSSSMTVTSCVAQCDSLGFRYAGAEYGTECYCGNSFLGADSGGGTIASGECTMNCGGDATQTCGAGFRLSSYERKANVTVVPVLPSGWSYTGCVSEPSSGRTLSNYSFVDGGMTIDKCVATCNSKGFHIAGAEYADECYCSDAFQATALGGGAAAPASDCNMPCAGESTQTCGAGNRLSIYSANQTTTTTPTGPTLPTGWAYVSCMQDGNARLLNGYTFSNSSMTVESCIGTCKARGFIYAGIENANECWCDNTISTANGGGVAAGSASECNMACAGNSNEICGAGFRISLYTKTVSNITALPTGWSPSMCAIDNNSRVLVGYQATDTALTPASCINKCASLSYVLAGVENGQECYCANILTNNPMGARDDQCNVPCAGDSSQNCGGGWRVMIYQKVRFFGKQFCNEF